MIIGASVLVILGVVIFREYRIYNYTKKLVSIMRRKLPSRVFWEIAKKTPERKLRKLNSLICIYFKDNFSDLSNLYRTYLLVAYSGNIFMGKKIRLSQKNKLQRLFLSIIDSSDPKLLARVYVLELPKLVKNKTNYNYDFKILEPQDANLDFKSHFLEEIVRGLNILGQTAEGELDHVELQEIKDHFQVLVYDLLGGDGFDYQVWLQSDGLRWARRLKF